MASRRPLEAEPQPWWQPLVGQFRGLDLREPAEWPLAPRVLLCLLIAAAVPALLWFARLSEYEDELAAARQAEQQLRADYQRKLRKAVSLQVLKEQRTQVLQHVTRLERQLPSKAEMSALLSDINQVGLERSLQFELFRPGQMVVRDYYAELPIAIRVVGRYHDIGAFAADVAHLSRIVTLNDIVLTPAGKEPGSGALTMEATARTFRYLDSEEIQAQREARKKAEAKK
ncbi:type 4a pilus biogenesis protein PilO [Melaminivora sp.]|uniref:type 4a pilus biogenesis protein PilO n=1 Tax=Melaminivora sp. TaxID=1933032 RepID=UPI0028ACF541|nr:type 4a pilus biogenesis protein PilO [Melaminivora sp.]